MPTRLHQLTEARFRRHPTSATFHGRDILAPIAAHWHVGVDLAEFGPPLQATGIVRLPSAAPRRERRFLIGEVISVDHFGNMITNVRSELIPTDACTETHVTIGSAIIEGISRFYAERPVGSLLALIGSSDRLEVAVNGGNAAERLGLGIGTTIRVLLPETRRSVSERA
jgi:S-adenosylmethionine hydrolase